MSEHYFTSNPTVQSDRREFSVTIRGKDYTFVTDRGVFSREGLDKGTELLLDTVPIPAAARVLDLGCGYGPIGIVVAANMDEGQVTMIDINERAAALAKENAVRNGVEVEVLTGNGFTPVKNRDFDLILTNPPVRAGKRVIYALFEEAYQHLSPGGDLYLVMRTRQGAKTTAKKLAEIFGNVETAAKGSGYRVLQATRPTM